MNNLIKILCIFLFVTFLMQAAEAKTVVLREWDNNKNIDYLEYGENYSMNNLRSYKVKSVYSDLQNKNEKGGYTATVKKYLMNCDEKTFLLQKAYYFKGDELVDYKKYNENFYKDDPSFGW